MSDVKRRILWIDDDPGYIYPFVRTLESRNFEVKVVRAVNAAEDELENENYDLLILDVMIPILSDSEEEKYPVADTNAGLKTGLEFYKRNRELIQKKAKSLLVFTVRPDKTIQEEFASAGLSLSQFATKVELKNMKDFVERIEGDLKREEGGIQS